MIAPPEASLPSEIIEYIARRMKINAASIFDKFGEITVVSDRKLLEGALERFVRIVMSHGISQDTCRTNPWEPSPAETAIHNCFVEHSSGTCCEKSMAVMDSLRHAFCNYAAGGLHQLLIGQEREDWYPKVVLDEVLEPNDIHMLPETIELYRGASLDEVRGTRFGQSWSTSERVAHDFAFTHYASQPWFDKRQRVVLKAVISRGNVYFSNQSGSECEVVVNVDMLHDVDVIHRG